MKQKLFCALLTVLLFSAVTVFAAGTKEEASPAVNSSDTVSSNTGKTVTVLDYTGKEKTIALPVKRVVVLDSGPILNIISAVGADSMVVGVVDFVNDMDDQYPIMSALPSAGNFNLPDFEKIFSLKPDLVIASHWQLKGLEENLEPQIPVIRFRPGSFEAYKKDVEQIAAIFGKEDKAKEYIAWYEGKVEVIQKRLANLPEAKKPRAFVYYGGEYGVVEGPPYGTYGKENTGSRYIDLAGGNNIAKNVPGDWITVDPEWVITENPDIIVREVYPDVSGIDVIGYAAKDSAGVRDMYDNITGDAVLSVCDAVKNKKVHIMFGGFFGREWFIGYHYLAKMFHPDLLKDIDPQAVHQEFLTKYLHSGYDLSKKGVFTFPK